MAAGRSRIILTQNIDKWKYSKLGTETKVRLRLNGKEVINNKLETGYLVLDK